MTRVTFENLLFSETSPHYNFCKRRNNFIATLSTKFYIFWAARARQSPKRNAEKATMATRLLIPFYANTELSRCLPHGQNA